MLNAKTLKFSSLVSLVAAGALLGVACGADKSGNPTNPGAGSSATAATGGGSATSGGAAAVAGSTGAMMDPPKPGVISVESAGVMPLRRLTHREFSNTMAELLGDTTKPGSKFEPDGPGPGGFEAPGTVATETARGYMDAAEALAAAALTAKTIVIPCTAPADAAAETTCVTTLVKDFGAKAYRRELVKSEVDDLVKLFQTAKTAGATFQEAVTAVVEAILQSPNLLYHWELGDQPSVRDPENAALVALTADQLASRLSYFLWESPPDAALQMAAKSGQLATVDGLKAQAARLLTDDTRARRALYSFHKQWLHMDTLDDIEVPLGQELENFVASIFVAGDGTLKSLLTAPYTFANASTAPEYGLTVNGSGFTQVQLDPMQRVGVLMQVPFLRTNGNAAPVRRGLAVYKQLLCGSVPLPAGNIPMVEADTPNSTLTTRERFAKHAELACATGCHAIFDPWGFALESFDSIGHYRTQEKGKPVDVTGLPQGPDAVIGGTTPKGNIIPFKNGIEMLNALSVSEEVSWCTSRHWSRFMLGRMDGDADAGAMSNAYLAAAYQPDRLTARAFSVKDFLVSIVGTKAFRYRTPSAGETL
jgi:Protein of unknown function (DUF1592)/Protein of unknown function (DUF1588)/Protein of unknown function (DUF1595)/Protein of unknown function (DUF1587)